MCDKKDYKHGQIVYREGEPCKNVYIAQEGEFECIKKLSRCTKLRNGTNPKNLTVLETDLQKQSLRDKNPLAKRMPEIEDIPNNLRLNIFEQGSLIGEDDVVT